MRLNEPEQNRRGKYNYLLVVINDGSSERERQERHNEKKSRGGKSYSLLVG